MARPDVAEALAACLEEIRKGRPPAACLADYPDLAEELEPLLLISRRIVAPSIVVDPRRKLRARHGFVEALHRESRIGSGWWLGLLAPLRPRLAMPLSLVLVLMLTLGSGGGIALASQQAQPGDALYGIKTAIERVQLVAATSEEEKAAIGLQIAERRLQEILAALEASDEHAVEVAAQGREVAMAQTYRHIERAQEQNRDVAKLLAHLERQQERYREALEKGTGKAAGPARQALERLQARQRDEDSVAAEWARSGLPKPADRDQHDPSEQSSSGGAAATKAPASQPSGEPADQAVAAKAEAIGSAVEALADGDTADGDGLGGLRAKLEAARASLQRGQWETAANQLAAFGKELEAMNRSGRIDTAEYERLQSAHKELLAWLSSQSQPAAEKAGRGRGAEEGAVAPAPASAPPTPAGGSAGQSDGAPGRAKDKK